MKQTFIFLSTFFFILGFHIGCSDNSTVLPAEDFKIERVNEADLHSDTDSYLSPSHCSLLGTWDEDPPDTHLLQIGPHSQGLSGHDPGITVTITAIDGCSFELTLNGKTKKIECNIPNLILPLKVGTNYMLDACEAPFILDTPYDFIVLRDMRGELILAGGMSNDLFDLSCIPSELNVKKVDDNCQPIEEHNLCGPRKNFGIYVSHQSNAVELWSGEAADLIINSLTYKVYNFYSFSTVNWKQNCSDPADQYMSWVIIRKTP